MAKLGVTYLPSALSSDAGYADLPLALLGAPVSIGAVSPCKHYCSVFGSVMELMCRVAGTKAGTSIDLDLVISKGTLWQREHFGKRTLPRFSESEISGGLRFAKGSKFELSGERLRALNLISDFFFGTSP